MSVVDGQQVNAAVTNAAFVSKTATTGNTATGIINLDNTSDPNSGATINNTQRAINETFDAVGMTGVNDTTRKDYSSNNVVANGDNRKVAIGKLDAEFSGTTGHTHNGAAGEGPKVLASDLDDFNNFFGEFQEFTKDTVSGTTTDVTTQLSGKTPGGGTSVAGVITSAPDNRCVVQNKETETNIEDGEGQKVYGRLTESSGTWTLSFFTNEAGTETAHSLSSQNIRVFFVEVFTAETRPTIPSNVGKFGSLDFTADIVDASATQRGAVSTGTQTFAGSKTHNGTQQFELEQILKHISTPSNPSAGYIKIYAKSDDFLYKKTSAGVETVIGSGGGGGGALEWVEQANSPIANISNNLRVYEFIDEESQELWTVVRVPTSYTPGQPIALKLGFYANGTSNTVDFKTQSTLIRAGTDAITSTTNQRTATTAVTTLSSPANKLNSLSFDITDTSGQINSVAVSASDLIIVRLYRNTGDSFTGAAYVPVYGAEVTFS